MIFTRMYFWGFFLIVLLFYSLLYKRKALRNFYLFAVSYFFYYKTGGLFVFVKAIGDIGLGIVLRDPGEDVFGVERHAVNRGRMLGLEFSQNQAHTVRQEELQGRIGELPE